MAVRLSGDFDRLERLITRAGRIASPQFRRNLLDAMAAEVNRQIGLGFRLSQDPYGRPWEPLRSRAGRPLVKTGKLQRAAQSAPDVERLAPVARGWERRVRAGFIDTYRETVTAGGLYADARTFDAALPLLALFELEKALYELRYEMDNRPDWVGVPLAGIVGLGGA